MRSLLHPALLTIGVIAGLSSVSAAWAQAPSEIAARRTLMRSNNQGVQTLNPIVRGEAPWNQTTAVQQADVLVGNAGKIASLFPEGTGPDKGATNALPAIWTNAAEFQAKIKTFGDESAKLLQLARANDEAGFKAQFPKIGQACGGCHQAFRKPLN